jgi:hypothetical protein
MEECMDLAELITARIAELTNERDTFHAEANRQLTGYNAAIQENERLLDQLQAHERQETKERDDALLAAPLNSEKP